MAEKKRPVEVMVISDSDEDNDDEPVKINARRRRAVRTIEDFAPAVCVDPAVVELAQQRELLNAEAKADKEAPLNDNRNFVRQYKQFRDVTVPGDRILSLLQPFVAPAKLEQRKVTNWAGYTFLEDAWLTRLGMVPTLADLYHFDAQFTEDNRLCYMKWVGDKIPVEDKAPVTIVSIYLLFPRSAHANVLLLHHRFKTGFLFEPHGKASLYTYTLLFDIFKKALPEYKMLYMPTAKDGPQANETDSPIYKDYLTMMRRGSCSIWCLLFTHAVVLHGLHPYQVMLGLSRLSPNDALLTSRGYTSSVMAEFDDPTSVLRTAALPVDTKTWPLQIQQMLPKASSSSSSSSSKSIGPGVGATSARVRQSTDKDADDTGDRPRAVKKKEQKEKKQRSVWIYKVPRALALQPKRDDIDVFQLHIHYDVWITLMDKDKVHALLDAMPDRWHKDSITLVMVNHLATPKRGDTTVASQIKYAEGLLKGLDLLGNKNTYLGANNGLPILDWKWTLNRFEGQSIGSKSSKLFQFHLYPRDGHTTKWELYDTWKSNGKKHPMGKSETQVLLGHNLLSPRWMLTGKENLYSYWLSFDDTAEYPMPVPKDDRTYIKVMEAHLATTNLLPTETVPRLYRLYNFTSFQLKTRGDWELVYEEFKNEKEKLPSAKSEKLQKKVAEFLTILDIIFRIKLQHFGRQQGVSLKFNLADKMTEKSGSLRPFHFNEQGYLLQQSSAYNRVYNYMPKVLRLAVHGGQYSPRRTLLRYLLWHMKDFASRPRLEYNYWIRSGFARPASAATAAKYTQVFELDF
jgi:hypothetical protein